MADTYPIPVAPPLTLPRIVCDPRILGGEPTVRGTRISVRIVVLAQRGWGTTDRVLQEYPQLERADIDAALAYYQAHQSEVDRYVRENLED
ncbi:MAG: DUF433 domain-containing protein [Chloroflexota bacterium]